MIRSPLQDNWFMHRKDSQKILPATVPGSVYHDLLQNGEMQDPYYRDNEEKALRLMDNDYIYETVFTTPEDVMKCNKVVLYFSGLDTVADIRMNGSLLGHVENMHREWDFDVTSILKQEGNQLSVYFYSPNRFIKEAYDKNPVEGTDNCSRGFPLLRKAHCMFGWDWGARLPDAGIWREVMLLGIEEAAINSVYIRQRHKKSGVTLTLEADIRSAKGEALGFYGGAYQCFVTIKAPDGTVLIDRQNKDVIELSDIKLWWPNGYGRQDLYTVRLELMKDMVCLDVWERRIGLRTMSVSREKDWYGEEFAHVVNGVKLFAMGADYIPEDSILSRVTPDRTYHLLKQAQIANFNCIRVWGGGYYPSDAFYDVCDELGLIVWQDFMFACAMYDLGNGFEENIIEEFKDNIKRIRHHACLGLWCGNNEMELFADQGKWGAYGLRKSDYVKMYEYIIPKILKQYDPETFYWPASPSSGGGFDMPNDENRGDVHYWQVWHGGAPFTEYRSYYFRYVSEFGFQSFPSLKTIETFTEESDRNVFSYVMEKHQRNAAANGKIMSYLEQTFLYPNSLDLLVYASQLLQAEAIRYGVEHFRRNRGRCMGTIIWQLNDCWPVASWASIDYYGRWKALHYYAKRFFAPLLISCKEEGILTQNSNVNAEPYEVRKAITLCISNESRKSRNITVVWSLRNAKAEIIETHSTELTVKELSSYWLKQVELSHAALYSEYVSYCLQEKEENISSGTVLFCPPKYFHFEDPKLELTTDGRDIIVTAGAYAKSVEIRNGEDDLLLSDNFFDMDAGMKKVRILSGRADRLIARSVYDIR